MLIWTNTYGQTDKLIGTWVSRANDVMFISDTSNIADNSNMLCSSTSDEGMAFYNYGKVLSFQKQYYSSATNYNKLYIDRYDLVIINQTDSTLTVNPSTKLSKNFFGNRTNIKFIKQEYNLDRTIFFEKIIYHTTSCYGNCPTIDLELDKNGNVYLDGEFYKDNIIFGEIDSNKSGQFIGKLDDTLFNEFINILQTCNLNNLIFPTREGADGPVTTIIIYYNGKRKYLKSMFPPTIADKLIGYLYQVNERILLTRTSEKRKLEK